MLLYKFQKKKRQRFDKSRNHLCILLKSKPKSKNYFIKLLTLHKMHTKNSTAQGSL